MKTDIHVRQEMPADDLQIDELVWSVFGPGMTARAAYVLREGVSHEPALSFVAEQGCNLVGTVRLTEIEIGETTVLMLGPLAVKRSEKGQGIGKALMAAAMEAALDHSKTGGPKAVFLVGDLAYYQPFGFERTPPDSILLPRPADPSRILVAKLEDDIEIRGAACRRSS